MAGRAVAIDNEKTRKLLSNYTDESQFCTLSTHSVPMKKQCMTKICESFLSHIVQIDRESSSLSLVAIN